MIFLSNPDYARIVFLMIPVFLILIFVFYRQQTLYKYSKELEKQKELYELVLEKSSSSVLIIDIDANKFIDCNKQAIEILKCNSKNDVLNFKPSDLSPEFQPDGRRSDEKSDDMNGRALINGSHTFEWKHLASTKEEFWVEVNLTVIMLGNKKVLHVVWKDIKERKEAEEKLQQQKEILNFQAHHDALTQLPNRTLFSDRVSQAIKRSKRQNKSFALLFIDLDRFKQINDSLGHMTGDHVLQVVAKRLRNIIRSVDTLSRLGGDEFTILMEESENETSTVVMAKKIIDTLADPIFLEDHTFYISCSIGISLYPKDGTDEHSLLKYADAAMYKAKEEGRNNFQFYSTEMTQKAFEHVMIEAKLRLALKNNEFVVFYQPQIDGTNGKITGMEALVRWQHPESGLLTPDKFLPVAEETGLIVQLDQWVMQTAIRQFVKWHAEGLNPGTLALNLSIKRLQQKEFILQLITEIQESHINPEFLEFEVSESQIMKNPEESINILQQINHMGIRISIDDFGTGYSSLSYLKRLPVTKLKIDKSFLHNIPGSDDDASIIKAIIALANSLDLSVIAEGVEQEAQKEFLTTNGCNFIQGYLYSRPISREAMTNYLNA